MPRLEPCLVLLVSFALTCRVLAQLSTNPCIPASNSTSSPCVELAEPSTSSQKDCSQARCAVRFSAPCPRHSDLIEGLIPQGECCPLPSRCACRPQATCPTALCPSGSKALRVSMATGEPGNCCDAYECRTGAYRKRTRTSRYSENTSVLERPRSERRGDLGQLSRKGFRRTAPLEPGGEPAGCFARGKLRGEGARWRADRCTVCRCVSGRAHCTVPACAQRCDRPARLPGECCPRCRGGANFTVMADTCVTAPCNLTTSDCPYGFPLDADGCRKCTCQKRKEFCAQLVSGCSLVCPHGRRFGPHGCEVCRCRKRSKRCRPLVCSKRCLHGFVRNRHGCDKCRCLKCPAMTCSKHCPLGYITSAKGCPLCKCRSTKAPSRTCRGRSGRLIANRETWHDGCRACRCIAGKEMCGLISCPPLTCTEPHLRPGHCCPSCPGEHARRPSTPVLDPTVCLGPWGERHSAGDAWQLEPCTRCVCYGGHTLCEAERCPPLPCPEPVRSPSTCCPLCPANNTDQTASQPSPPPCQTSEGLSLPAGGAWRQDACTSCSCHAGELRCYTARCPSTPCSHPLLRKDQCCPYCPRFDTRRLQADSHQAFNVIEAMMGHNISHEGHKGTEAPPQGSVAEAAAWALTSLTLVAVIVAALLYARRKDPRLAALCRPDKGAREAGMRNTQSREASRGKNENSTTGWQSDTQHATQAACSPITIESA